MLTDGTLKYVYGLGPTYAVDGSGNVQVYHTDGLGSIRAITDANGNVIQTYQTDEFGVPIQTQGSSSQPFQLTGQQADSNALIYLLARYYDPATGRFLSRDPLRGALGQPQSLNRYAYAGNNPTTLTDPSGLDPGTDDPEAGSEVGGDERITELEKSPRAGFQNVQILLLMRAAHQQDRDVG